MAFGDSGTGTEEKEMSAIAVHKSDICLEERGQEVGVVQGLDSFIDYCWKANFAELYLEQLRYCIAFAPSH